jgi:hypothetical protein
MFNLQPPRHISTLHIAAEELRGLECALDGGQFQAAANVLSIFFLWRTRSIGISGNVDRRHHASRDLTKPHIGLEILPRRRFGFLLRDHLMRSSTVVCATFSTRAIARMPSPF